MKPPKDFDRPRFLRVYMALFFVFLFAPIALVVLFSFNSTRSLQNFDGFSLRWYEQFFGSESLRDSLAASIQIALVTMVVATVIGTLLAYGLVRSRTRWSGCAERPHAGPARDSRRSWPASPRCSCSRRSASSCRSPRSSSVTSRSRSRTSRSSCARGSRHSAWRWRRPRWTSARRGSQTFRLITLPALWPAILAAGLLVFALSFDDFVLSFFTTGESPQPLPVRIWSAIRFGVTPTINAIGTFMLAVSVLTIGLAIALPRLLGRRESGLRVLMGREAA